MIATHFLIAYHNSLKDVQTNYCNNNLLILNMKQLNKIMKLDYIYTLKTLWDVQGKIKMYYGMSRVKKQLLGKKSIVKNYGINWNLYYQKILFFRYDTTECHFRISGLRYEWRPYLKPLTTYFQNVHLQCKNNKLLECKPATDIY